MKNAQEFIKIREEKIKEFEQENNKIQGQWKLIESIIDSAEITKDTKYIDISKVGRVYDKNIEKLIKEGFFIDEGANCSHCYLFFSSSERSDFYSNKKLDFKINQNKQVTNEKNIQINKDKLKDNTLYFQLDNEFDGDKFMEAIDKFNGKVLLGRWNA